MQKQNKQIVVLFITLCSIIIVISVYQYFSRPPGIIDFQSDDIQKIEIETVDKPRIVLERTNSDWYVIDGTAKQKANSILIQNILELASAMSQSQFPAIKSELHKYELDKPRLAVYFNGQGIFFGDLNPMNNYRYLLVNNTIHLIKDDYYRHLLSTEQEFVKP